METNNFVKGLKHIHSTCFRQFTYPSPNSYNSLQHYHTYSTYVRSVPPVPITHFSITTITYVHVEAYIQIGPPTTSNSLQHMHIYSSTYTAPGADNTKIYRPLTNFPSVAYVCYNCVNNVHTRPVLTVTPSACVPNTGKVVTSTAGPPGPHLPKKVLCKCYI